MELWTTPVQCNTIAGNLPSLLEALTGRKLRTSLPRFHPVLESLWKHPGSEKN